MAVDVSVETVIDRGVEIVAAYASDPSNAPEWYANISRVDWVADAPLGVGARMAFVAKFLGRTLEYTYEVTEYEPGRRLVMRTSEGPFPMETTYEFAALDDGVTRMTLRNRGEPAGFSRLFAPFMAPAMKRANTKDLTKLKAIVESR